MAGFDSLLGLLGLTTRSRLNQAVAKQKMWHGLVRDVFAQYYLKLREPFFNYVPELPHRYSPEWEDDMRRELDNLLSLDTESVSDLLTTCGFGTEKWERLKEAGFPELRNLIEEHITGEIGDGQVSLEEFEAALKVDMSDLLTENPEILEGFSERFDPDEGVYRPTDEEVRSSPVYRELESKVRKLNPAEGGEIEEEEESDFFLVPGSRKAADPETQIRELNNELKAQQHTIETLQAELQRLEKNQARGIDTSSDGDPAAELRELKSQLKTKEHAISTLEDQLQKLQSSQDDGALAAGGDDGTQREIRELKNQVKSRDHTIETLSNLDKQDDSDPRDTGERGDSGRDQEVQSLKNDLKAKEHTIETLREQLEKIESELGQARERLMAEIRKLAALTAGEIELLPAAELDRMDSDELLDYAEEVAKDLDVRRQTLEHGLEGVDTLRNNYEESKKLYDSQQFELQEQLEGMHAELESLEQKQQSQGDVHDASSQDIITKQREQLALLSTRIRELMSSNKELNESYQSRDKDLEQIIRRINPLRQQIQDLETLQDTLLRYIRGKYDRTFILSKLKE